MVIADQPTIPPAFPSGALIASANPEQQLRARSEHIFVCGLAHVEGGDDGFSPIVEANLYFNTNPEKIKPETAEIRVLQQPKHGTLKLPEPLWAGGSYLPKKGYLGNDTFVIQVKGNGYTVRIRYFFRVVEGAGGTIYDNKKCKGPAWKLSLDSENHGHLPLAG